MNTDLAELFKVNYKADRITLSARNVHEFLEVKTQYTKWFQRMCEYGFDENIDYRAISQKRLTAQGNETAYVDHEISLDMAKEIAMLQRNEKGREARQYFLELERKWNSPEYVMQRALRISEQRIAALEDKIAIQNQQISEMEEKSTYYDIILNCKDLITTSVIAKDFGWSGIRMNKYLHDKGIQYKLDKTWLLYQKHADKGYASTRTYTFKDKDGEDHARPYLCWTQKGRLFIYETLKADGILPLIERKV